MTDRDEGEIVQIKLRCREILRAQLEKEALANNRSVNSEINQRLEESFEVDIRTDILTSRLFAMVLDILGEHKGKPVDSQLASAIWDEWTRTEAKARGIKGYADEVALLRRHALTDQKHPVWGLEAEGNAEKKPPDEPAQDGQPAKGRRKKPPAE